MVSGGALAGIPVWTGGSTSFYADPLAPAGGERAVLAPSVTRIDLFPTGEVLASSIPIGARPGPALSRGQVDEIVAGAARA